MNSYIENNNENRRLLQARNKCDRYDYLAAVACGAIGGIVDIFLVGTPKDSKLTAWTDQQVDEAVKIFARKVVDSPKRDKINDVATAIGCLEDKYRINYDQRYGPDVIGLFFSILNQFTSTASFVANGKVITIKTETYELQGHNFIAKLFCGVANWFGHIMSDIAGSTGSRGNDGRGTGIVMPFYELFQFCNFGKFNIQIKNKEGEIVKTIQQDLATLAVRAFENGYDFRHGLAMAIPVIITDLSIRLIWSIRKYFQYEIPLKECIPTGKHEDLRIMLLFGNGTLCLMDTIDAGIQSGGCALVFFMRLNLVAWFRFVMLVLKEVCIRVGITNTLQDTIEAYKQINESLVLYLKKLESIDIELFQKETKEYTEILNTFSNINSEKELNEALLAIYEKLGIKKPWEGDFNEFMSDKSKRLVFE